MKKTALLLICSCIVSLLFAGGDDDTAHIVRKEMLASRVEKAPRIDGALDDAIWQQTSPVSGFIQNSPVENAPASYQTEVRITYDDNALYVGAMMYDNAPDSIMRQLGLRDDDVNADNFRMVFDTYNTQQDAFVFIVTASGVQMDARISDGNFNAVWQSNVRILPNGWSAEIAIPWYALRFPTSPEQTWGVQFTRNIQRKFEFDQWALTPKGKANPLKYWGLLSGLKNIQAPVRLSLTPYLTTIWQNDDRFGDTKASTSLSGGLDLKYGLNESFTLDMTLLPDFSQVRSDNVVKNLGPFEVQFQEQRPFFTEGTDLFQRGDIFYSRRIGRTPSEFYSAPYLTNENEKIIKNPTRSKLLNVTKLSGRTNNGTGIGLLNAYVDYTYATAQDTLTGKTRKIMTEPRSNYNIFVFDKQMKYGSNVFVTNTNVIRTAGYRSANVTAAGFSLNNKKNTWNVSGQGGLSNILEPNDSIESVFQSTLGYKYNVSLSKTSGSFQYGLIRDVVSQQYDPNDMGINFEVNYATSKIYAGYYLFNPWKIFNNANVELSVAHTANLRTGEMNQISINYFSYATFRNFWSMYMGIFANPVDSRDYYEPRTDDQSRYYLRTRNIGVFAGFSSNYNKPVSVSFDFYTGTTARVSPTIPPNPWIGGGPSVNWRAGNRFTFGMSSNFHGDFGDRGWVNTEDDGTIVLGRREIRNIENTASASFVFMRDMSVSIVGRHYWATGHYIGYYILQQDGSLHDYVNYGGTHDYSFNSFNVDLVYKWIFAPGSVISFAWKLNVLNEESLIDYSYPHNFSNTLHSPQLNQLSVRILYFLDYNYVKNSVSKKPQE